MSIVCAVTAFFLPGLPRDWCPLFSSLPVPDHCSLFSNHLLKWTLVVQLLMTLFCDPVDCSPLGSSVRGISQARILDQLAISFSRGSSWPRDRTYISQVSWLASRLFTTSATCSHTQWLTVQGKGKCQPFHTLFLSRKKCTSSQASWEWFP